MWVGDLNHLYRTQPTLHEFEFDPRGFEWIDRQDVDACVISLLRHGRSPQQSIAVICSFGRSCGCSISSAPRKADSGKNC